MQGSLAEVFEYAVSTVKHDIVAAVIFNRPQAFDKIGIVIRRMKLNHNALTVFFRRPQFGCDPAGKKSFPGPGSAGKNKVAVLFQNVYDVVDVHVI